MVWFLLITLILTLGVPEWDRSIHILNLLSPDWGNGSILVDMSYNFGPYIIAVRSLVTLLFSFYFIVTLENSNESSQPKVLSSAESQGNYLFLIILLSFYIILSSYDLILLYISMELLALSSYLLAAMDWQGFSRPKSNQHKTAAAPTAVLTLTADPKPQVWAGALRAPAAGTTGGSPTGEPGSPSAQGGAEFDAAVARVSVAALAAEASLKYYIMGSISSSFYLLGTSLVYGIKGTINFGSLAASEALGITYNNDIFLIGIIFILFYFLFKLSIFPFHQWTPDVFQGVHINITAFFALLPKSVFFFLLPYLIVNFAPMIIFTESFNNIIGLISWNGISDPKDTAQTGGLGSAFTWNFVQAADPSRVGLILGLISILLGSFLGLLQSNMKRLLAYSSISNGGFMILALATNSFIGYNSFYFYLIIYLISNINLFTALHFRVNQVQEFKNLVYINPIFTFNFTILLFSLAGVPPLAGFLSKFQIFYSVTNYILWSGDSVAKFLIIVFLGLFLSLFAAFYYLRIIHFFYFFNPDQESFNHSVHKNWKPDILPSYLLSVSSLLLILLGLYPYPLIEFSNFLTLCI